MAEIFDNIIQLIYSTPIFKFGKVPLDDQNEFDCWPSFVQIFFTENELSMCVLLSVGCKYYPQEIDGRKTSIIIIIPKK